MLNFLLRRRGRDFCDGNPSGRSRPAPRDRDLWAKDVERIAGCRRIARILRPGSPTRAGVMFKGPRVDRRARPSVRCAMTLGRLASADHDDEERYGNQLHARP